MTSWTRLFDMHQHLTLRRAERTYTITEDRLVAFGRRRLSRCGSSRLIRSNSSTAKLIVNNRVLGR